MQAVHVLSITADEMLLCSLRMYNSLVEKCFKDCVESFRRKDLESTEEKVSITLAPPLLSSV